MAVDSNKFGINIGQEFQSGFAPWGSQQGDASDWRTYYPLSQVQGDLDYLYSLGVRNVRVAAPGWRANNAFVVNIIAAQLYTASLAFQKGFHVEFGVIPFFGLTPSDWKSWIDNMPTYAAQFQALVTQYSGSGVWMLGNENENYTNLGRETFVSITRSSNVITLVTSAPHSLTTGDIIRIFGHPTDNSGTVLGITGGSQFAVTVVNSTTFTFSSTGSDETTSTGWFSYGVDTVRKQMKRMATALKAASITVPLSYSCVQGTEGGTYGYFISNFATAIGRGDIDYLDLNIYGSYTEQNQNYLDFYTQVMEGVSRVGISHFRVTEWHVTYTEARIPTDATVATYWILRRQELLESIPGMLHFFFCYRKTSNELAVKKPYTTNAGGYFRDWWWPLVKKRQPTYEATFNTPELISGLRSNAVGRSLLWSGLAMNYGQDTQSGSYDTATITADLDKMWTIGVRKLRIAMSDYTQSSAVATSKTLASAAKAKGYYVVWGVAHQLGNLSDANWSDYTTAVLSAATWAAANGIDEFCLGNEIEYNETGGSLTSSVSKIKTLAAAVKTANPSLVLSYAMAQSAMEYTGAPGGWISSGKGSDITYLGYNVYGDNGLSTSQAKTQFETRITDLYAAFGSTLYISEWNLGVGTLFPSDNNEKIRILKERWTFIKNLGIAVAYFFCYRWDNGGTYNKTYFPIILATKYVDWANGIFSFDTPNRTIVSGRTIVSSRTLV